MIDEAKIDFLVRTNTTNEDDALSNCVQASFKHNKIYLGGCDSIPWSQRYELHQSIKTELHRLSQQYIADEVTEAHHESNIQNFANLISEEHGTILVGGRFNIGTSQKGLNLYLKFMWCMGRMPSEPIHCPLDNRILVAAKVTGSWTMLDDIETYRSWITKIRSTAGGDSLPVWELAVWNKGNKA